MNLYVRYFDKETLAHNIDEIATFLEAIDEFKIENSMLDRVLAFYNSSNTYPFRLKVSYSNYVLFLKTEADTIEEFHSLEQQRKEHKAPEIRTAADRKRSILEALNEPREGWYEGAIMFKRVLLNPETNKCQYKDTHFRARVKARSAMECYERIIDHLSNRQDVDPRSQFPSAKSNNFEYKFLG